MGIRRELSPLFAGLFFDLREPHRGGWGAAVKAATNADKHGVTFEQAATVFLDPLALTVFDEAHSQDEERWWLLGHDANGTLLLVAHTHQATGPASASVRLISARPATRRERQFYEDEPR